MLIDKIRSAAKNINAQVVNNRRQLHAHPEISFHEYETSAFVKKQLDAIGISWQAMADTGVVGIIKGDIPSEQAIALRADMDALPIHELNDVAYRSTYNGIMHACGHDAHTASLLGTASILQSVKGEFAGTIKLIFQPAEEKLPGGASLMIEEGVLSNPAPQAVIGQHVFPSLPVGKIALRKGKQMASMDELSMTVFGKGGHAAQPHQNIDPVLITAHIIVALQQIVSRSANPSIPSVLSFGKLIADGAINVIPGKVEMQGAFRTMDENWRSEAHTKMKKMAEGIAESMGGSCAFSIVRGYPFLINEEDLTTKIQQYAGEYLGVENVTEAATWMAAEDFSYFSQATAACFYLLGVGNKEKGIHSELHTPTFNIDESALEISCGLMAYIALRRLGVK